MAGKVCPGRIEWTALFLLAMVKIGLLVRFGPTWESDWDTYSAFADLILSDRRWLTDAGLAVFSVPTTLFRSIGYPLTVAAFRAVVGNRDLAHVALILVQIAIGLVAVVQVWRVASRVLGSRSLAFLTALGQAGGSAMLYDQSLLSDGLFNAIIVFGWSIPLIGLLDGRRPSLAAMGGLGALFAYACLLRGTGVAFTLMLLPPLALWTWRHRLVFRLAAFALPVAAVVGGDMAWNHARTGTYVMTTGAQYVFIQSLVKEAEQGYDMFDGDTPLDRVARGHLKTYAYKEVMEIVDALFHDEHLDALQSAALHKEVYLRAWWRHPEAMLAYTLHNFDEGVVFQFLDPLDNASFYSRLVADRRLFPGIGKTWAAARHGSVGMMGLLVAAVFFRTLSFALMAVLIVGGPLLLWRRRRDLSPVETAVLWLWTLYFAYTLFLCAIYISIRFMPAVAGGGLIAALYLARRGIGAVSAGKAFSSGIPKNEVAS